LDTPGCLIIPEKRKRKKKQKKRKKNKKGLLFCPRA
jgi:hypothetical protein